MLANVWLDVVRFLNLLEYIVMSTSSKCQSLLNIKCLKPLIKDGTCMSGINSRCMARLLAQVNNKLYTFKRALFPDVATYNGPA